MHRGQGRKWPLLGEIDLVLDLVYAGRVLEVNVHQAKTQLSKLLERVARGEEVIIAKAGRPVARLVPLVHAGPRTWGQDRGLVQLSREFFSADEEIAELFHS